MVQEHNRGAAQAWSAGGADYDFVSFALSDALAHAAQRLWAQPGEQILDIATGTGWTARNAARGGAEVSAVDIADDLLAAAERLSAHVRPRIAFRHADAEALPFDDATFDGVISTFGLMFAGNQVQAAAEAARVCQPGGRLVLTTWVPDPAGYVTRFFGIVGKYNPAPPPAVSPMAWGEPEHVRGLLGQAFDLTFETRDSMFHCPSGGDAWAEYQRGFGPIRALAAGLDDDRREAFRRDFVDFHEGYRGDAGLTVPRRYLLTFGIRK
jgi:SAM-dependent methyltransferase